MRVLACTCSHLRSAALARGGRLSITALTAHRPSPAAAASHSAVAARFQHSCCSRHSGKLGASLSACSGRAAGGKRGAASVAAAAAPEGDAAGNDDLWLLVGLGNPGAQYEDTRHNIGFQIIDRLGDVAGVAISQKQHNALVGRSRLWDSKVILAKPTTFMNNSGKAVRKLMDYYKVRQDRLLVIYDDLDTAPAKMRLRAKGGHGGHNGMRSIVSSLGNSQEFARLRVGIGRPAGQRNIADYVLEDFSKGEREEMEFGVREALDTVKAVLVEGMDRAVSGVRV